MTTRPRATKRTRKTRRRGSSRQQRVKGRTKTHTKIFSASKSALVVTRQFGLTPLRRCSTCNALGIIREKKKAKEMICPVCQQAITDSPPLLAPDLFQKFANLVNIMIRRGLHLSSKWFQKGTLTAVKRFHDHIKQDSQVHKVFKAVKLHNSLQRCAAQYAYFSIREYKQRRAIIQVLADVVAKELPTGQGIGMLTNPKFPMDAFVVTCRRALLQAFGTTIPLTKVYLVNMLRYVRNLLYQMLLVQDAPLKQVKESTVPEDQLQTRDVLAQWLWGQLPALAEKFARRLSRLLTQRVNKLLEGHGPRWRKGALDGLISQICAFSGERMLSPQGTFLLTAKDWEKCRKYWRNHLVQALQESPAFFLLEQIITCVDQNPRTSTKKSVSVVISQEFPPLLV